MCAQAAEPLRMIGHVEGDRALVWTERGVVTNTFRAAPAPAATGRVALAVGSCCKIAATDRARIFDTIAAVKPDVMLWLGDNWYLQGPHPRNNYGKRGGKLIRGEWSDEKAMLRRALSVRRHPALRRLFAEAPNYATWDDHDFGFNNAPLGDPEELTDDEVARIFAGREAALRVFERMWANPAYGTAEMPGVFFTFRRGPVEVFMMDNRYYKDARAGHIWGDGQLEWLKRGLLQAEQDGVPVKIVANGCQVLATTKKESFHAEAPGELESLLSFIHENGIQHVLFLSGDRHRSELWVKEAHGRQFVELTASPLHHEYRRVDPANYPDRVWVGPPVNNFGLVSVEIPADGEGFIEFEVRDENGLVLSNLGPTREVVGAPCRSRYSIAEGKLISASSQR